MTATRQAKKLTIWHILEESHSLDREDCLHCNPWPKGQGCCENSTVSVTIFTAPLSFESLCHSVFHWTFPVSQLQNPELLMIIFHCQVFQNEPAVEGHALGPADPLAAGQVLEAPKQQVH